MTKEPEARSVLEKANSILRQMISVPQEPATKMKPTTPVGSPRTLAIKRTEVELEYMEEAAQMDQAIQEKEEELRSAQCVGNNEGSQGLLRIEGELKALKDVALSFRNEKLDIANKLDHLVGTKQAEYMKEIDMEVAKFKRIVIQIESDNGDIGLKRSLKPGTDNMQAQVETFHPGYTCILSAIEELDETVEQDVFIRHTGRWLNSEVELFHAGVLQYGWGEWAKIADYIQTRDRIQVCKFSLNQRAKKFKSSKTIVPVLSDLAEGLKTIARTLESTQNDENE